jgi:hypothetical protein
MNGAHSLYLNLFIFIFLSLTSTRCINSATGDVALTYENLLSIQPYYDIAATRLQRLDEIASLSAAAPATATAAATTAAPATSRAAVAPASKATAPKATAATATATGTATAPKATAAITAATEAKATNAAATATRATAATAAESTEAAANGRYCVSKVDPSAACSSGEITLNASMLFVASKAFYQASINGSLTIPDAVETIRSSAFEETNLSELILGTGLQTIEQSAFQSCDFLDKFYFREPSTLVSIGNFAFQGDQALFMHKLGWY